MRMGLMGMLGHDPPPARFPDGRVGYAVGDIHGRADLLAAMILKLEARAEEDKRSGGDPVLVFLGDYVDRGKDSAGVIELLLDGRPHGFERRFLKGNHEQSMLDFLDAPLANRSWVFQGGAETLMSYGVAPPASVGAEDEAWLEVAAALKAALPGAHRAFLNSLERYIAFGDYAFVHAGVKLGRALDRQSDSDLFWIRDRFTNSRRRFSHRVVHGHTPVSQPIADERRIAIDTGAYASGVLTAVRLEAERTEFLAVSERDIPAPATAQPLAVQF